MTNALAVVLGLALSSGVVYAQAAPTTPAKQPTKRVPRGKRPAPPPAPAPVTTPEPAPAAAPPPTISPPAPVKRDRPGTDEKAGENESLHGTAAEPWKKDVPQSAQNAALVLFREGNTALNDGLFNPAVAKYRAALQHWNHPAIHYNLALALLNLDRPIEVFEQLNEAIIYGEKPLGADKFEHAKEYLLLIEKQLADIEVSCDKVGAKVAVDGKEVFVAPGKFSQKVRVGKHTFHAEKEGYNARITAPYIGPGEKFRIELKLYTAPDLTRERRRWSATWMPYAVIGGGALVGLAAGALELSAQSSYDEFNDKVAACNMAAMGCSINTPGITDARDSGDTKRMLSYVGYGVAGAAVATGAVLLWLNRREYYQVTPEEHEKQTGAIAVTPVVSPEMAGAMVQGSF